jgi:hypothetical protein
MNRLTRVVCGLFVALGFMAVVSSHGYGGCPTTDPGWPTWNPQLGPNPSQCDPKTTAINLNIGARTCTLNNGKCGVGTCNLVRTTTYVGTGTCAVPAGLSGPTLPCYTYNKNYVENTFNSFCDPVKNGQGVVTQCDCKFPANPNASVIALKRNCCQ